MSSETVLDISNVTQIRYHGGIHIPIDVTITETGTGAIGSHHITTQATITSGDSQFILTLVAADGKQVSVENINLEFFQISSIVTSSAAGVPGNIKTIYKDHNIIGVASIRYNLRGLLLNFTGLETGKHYILMVSSTTSDGAIVTYYQGSLDFVTT